MKNFCFLGFVAMLCMCIALTGCSVFGGSTGESQISGSSSSYALKLKAIIPADPSASLRGAAAEDPKSYSFKIYSHNGSAWSLLQTVLGELDNGNVIATSSVSDEYVRIELLVDDKALLSALADAKKTDVEIGSCSTILDMFFGISSKNSDQTVEDFINNSIPIITSDVWVVVATVAGDIVANFYLSTPSGVDELIEEGDWSRANSYETIQEALRPSLIGAWRQIKESDIDEPSKLLDVVLNSVDDAPYIFFNDDKTGLIREYDLIEEGGKYVGTGEVDISAFTWTQNASQIVVKNGTAESYTLTCTIERGSGDDPKILKIEEPDGDISKYQFIGNEEYPTSYKFVDPSTLTFKVACNGDRTYTYADLHNGNGVILEPSASEVEDYGTGRYFQVKFRATSSSMSGSQLIGVLCRSDSAVEDNTTSGPDTSLVKSDLENYHIIIADSCVANSTGEYSVSVNRVLRDLMAWSDGAVYYFGTVDINFTVKFPALN